MGRRCLVFARLLQGAGIDLEDEEIINQYKEYCRVQQEGKKE